MSSPTPPTPHGAPRRRSFLAATAAWLPLSVYGNAAAAPDEDEVTGKVVITGKAMSDAYAVDNSAAATRLPVSLRETPQSITVFTRQRLEDQNLQSLRDVLDGTPGVYSYAYDTERVLFTSRGFTIDNLLYDGVPAVTNFSTDSLDETLDTALYDRIEIVRGATGLITGAGSPAASVNLVRKRAASKQWVTELDVTGASWDGRRIEGDVSAPLNAAGSIRARLVGVYQDRESYQDLYRNKKQVLYGVIDADVAEHTRLSLGFDYQKNDPRGNTWGSFPLFLADGSKADWPRSVTTATDWSFWDKRKKTVFGELEQGFSNGWTLRSTLSWRRFNEDLALFYMFGFPDPQTGTGLDPYAYRSMGDITEKSLDLYATGPFELFGRQHSLVVGYNGSRNVYDGTEFEPGTYADPGNFFEWDGSYPEPAFAQQGFTITDIKTRRAGSTRPRASCSPTG